MAAIHTNHAPSLFGIGPTYGCKGCQRFTCEDPQCGAYTTETIVRVDGPHCQKEGSAWVLRCAQATGEFRRYETIHGLRMAVFTDGKDFFAAPLKSTEVLA